MGKSGQGWRRGLFCVLSPSRGPSQEEEEERQWSEQGLEFQMEEVQGVVTARAPKEAIWLPILASLHALGLSTVLWKGGGDK